MTTAIAAWAMCGRKHRYGSRRAAERAAKRLSVIYGIKYRDYPCPHCKGYHLATKRKT